MGGQDRQAPRLAFLSVRDLELRRVRLLVEGQEAEEGLGRLVDAAPALVPELVAGPPVEGAARTAPGSRPRDATTPRADELVRLVAEVAPVVKVLWG